MVIFSMVGEGTIEAEVDSMISEEEGVEEEEEEDTAEVAAEEMVVDTTTAVPIAETINMTISAMKPDDNPVLEPKLISRRILPVG